ncbi:MAG: M43 family zinc metalloprotease [Chitinophagaceae bacterium]
MLHRLKLLLILCVFCVTGLAQTVPATSCGQQDVMQHFYATHPEYRQINNEIEHQLAERNRAIQSGTLKTQRTTGIVTLPVVVHIIHNNGSENISDAQVFQGIQHLNEAFANTGYYDPSDGVPTQIQFCMAQRDPSNNPTNGITRDVSANTVMGGANYYSDDQQIKNINRWNPLCYINIWLVKSIPGSVVGYAYLPSAHGTGLDGIIEEAGYFGGSLSNDVVITHEMGHYLGLYHTFEGACTNNDCTSDGDKVCDTPPDQSTAGISCSSSVNSCTTDVLSGFATDQNDLTQDYMDYGNFNCMKVFTQGQADRMNWYIQNVRKSLLACKSCMNPCPALVTASFNQPPVPFYAGSSYTFTNASVNAASYEWYVNGVLQTTTINFTYTFPLTGIYSIKLIAKSGSQLCDDAVMTNTLTVVCGAVAGFTKSATSIAAGSNINFTNTSTGATDYEWQVNGTAVSTAINFSYTSSTAGQYIIKLVAKNTPVNCQQSFTDTVNYTCAVIADFTPPAGTATLINIPMNFVSTSTGASSFQWLVNGVVAGSGPTLIYTFTTPGAYTVQLVAGNGSCLAVKNSLVYVGDKCGNAQYQFQKNYGAGLNSSALHMHSTPDGGTVLAERIITNGGSSININGAILKLDAAGNAQWMNHYGTNNTNFRRIRTTPDGGYIAIGNISNAGNVNGGQTFIVKTDPAGAVTWSRQLAMPSASDNDGFDIVASADGNYYFTGTVTLTGVTGSTTDILAAKLDGSGSLQWIKTYDAGSFENGNGLTEDNSYLVICGNKSLPNGNAGILLQVEKSTGNVVWANSYQSANENFLDVQTIAGGYYVNGLRASGGGGLFTDHVFIKTDGNGKLTYSKYIRPFGLAKETGAASSMVKPDGHIISQTTGMFGGTYYDYILQEINPATGVVWTKKYNKPNGWLNTVYADAGNNIWAAGFSVEATAPAIQTFVMKVNSAGNAGSCPSTNADVQVSAAQYNSSPLAFSGRAIQVQTKNDHVATPVIVTPGTSCQYVACDSVVIPADTCAACSSISLLGADTVCSITTTQQYTLKRNPGCPAVPSFVLSDNSYGTITHTNDSTIQINFTKAGGVKLYSSINTGCKVFTDSIFINVLQTPGAINLGADRQLCVFSSIQLNAGPGFKTYLWNDGSEDASLTAYNPGQYFVRATDYCGVVYADTVVLALAPVIPFELGPDLQKCNSDTLTILAPGSLSAYSWATNYNINNVKGAIIKVWPSVDTTYIVVAQVDSGCTVIDSIRITVKKSPQINIGSDTSFCAGDSLLLTAPAGFSKYLWQDGSGNSTYTATRKGIYWLRAEAINGCTSVDTAIIKNIYPLPANFLNATAEICNGKMLELKANSNWSAYKWSNSSTAPSVNINAAGNYWLQVTSADGCVARDSITVMAGKQCGSGIYFPNAFTPDKNSYNDTYKPVVYTMPEKFQLFIYNRFGEQVFTTTDCKKGWDGVYKGKPQSSATFVWYCKYQFAGGAPKLEKGALVLIR